MSWRFISWTPAFRRTTLKKMGPWWVIRSILVDDSGCPLLTPVPEEGKKGGGFEGGQGKTRLLPFIWPWTHFFFFSSSSEKLICVKKKKKQREDGEKESERKKNLICGSSPSFIFLLSACRANSTEWPLPVGVDFPTCDRTPCYLKANRASSNWLCVFYMRCFGGYYVLMWSCCCPLIINQ